MDKRIIELAKKIKALADGGVDGEKNNATQMLEDFMLKHNISIDDIMGEKKTRRMFAVKAEQRKFFRQVVSSVVGSKYHYQQDGSRYYITVTDEQYAEISLKYDFYWNLYQNELSIFYSAFVQANKLYRKPTEEDLNDDAPDNRTKEQKERDQRIVDMSLGIKRDSPLKRIGNHE